MLRVDVVYESEILPRLVLLKQHMQILQIELVLHKQLPDTHSPRVVYAPRATNSALHNAVEDDSESIGLYFYNIDGAKTSLLPADLTVTLPTWPARSADQAVAEFARYLHKHMHENKHPHKPLSSEHAATDQETTGRNAVTAKSAEQNTGPIRSHEKRAIDWQAARNLAILIGMVVAATWMVEQIPDASQPTEADPLPPAVAVDAASTVIQTVEPAAGPATSPDAPPSNRVVIPSLSEPELTVKSHRAESCAGSADDILRAVLTLQAPTDFGRCLQPPGQPLSNPPLSNPPLSNPH